MASARAASSSSASGTTCETRPIRSASAASMVSPVRVSSAALEKPTIRCSSQAPPSPGMIPSLTKLSANFALSPGYAQVAHAGEIEPGTDRRAVDCGDHRHFQRGEGQRQALDSALVIAPGARGQAGVKPAAVGPHRLEVAACGKGRAGPGQDRDADLRIVFHRGQGGEQRLDQIEVRDRIAQFGAVERDRGNAIGIAANKAPGYPRERLLEISAGAMRRRGRFVHHTMVAVISATTASAGNLVKPSSRMASRIGRCTANSGNDSAADSRISAVARGDRAARTRITSGQSTSTKAEIEAQCRQPSTDARDQHCRDCQQVSGAGRAGRGQVAASTGSAASRGNRRGTHAALREPSCGPRADIERAIAAGRPDRQSSELRQPALTMRQLRNRRSAKTCAALATSSAKIVQAGMLSANSRLATGQGSSAKLASSAGMNASRVSARAHPQVGHSDQRAQRHHRPEPLIPRHHEAARGEACASAAAR